MDNDDANLNLNRRIVGDRRSGTDTRSDAQKQLIGERRSIPDRQSGEKTFRLVLGLLTSSCPFCKAVKTSFR